ncbi:MAG TPA: SRPBCC family protein [Haliangiales bacterium]|nr:SRPBCC family protein [Haliangiales bacterium]
MSTDRIEKKIVLNAPRSRVWRALADAKEFGSWFGAKLQGAIVAGAQVEGRVTTPGYENLPMVLLIERVEPERLLSYRWHPYAIELGRDYSAEPTTLVEFKLEEVAGGTQLTVVESGFDRLPEARRAEAWKMNEGGWTAQMRNIERHVAT